MSWRPGGSAGRAPAGDRTRRLVGFVVALALHLLIFVGAARLALRAARFPVLDAPPLSAIPEIDIEADRPSEPKPLPALGAAPAPAAITREPRPKRSVPGPPSPPSQAPLSSAAEAATGIEPPAASTADEWSPRELGPPGDAGALTQPLGLAWSSRLDTTSAPAPTQTPRARPLPEGIEELAVTSALRSHNAELGLGNPEENAVATAVKTAGRAAAVPKDTRFRVEVRLGADGRIESATIASASAGDEATWAGVLSAIRGGLGDRVEIGPDVRRAGARVVVDAVVKHVFVSGSDEAVTSGACPTDPHTSGMWDAVPFHWVGGAMYGEPATGACALSDATNGQPKQIQVRTKVTTVLPGAPPPPTPTFGPSRKKPRLPSIWEVIFPPKGGLRSIMSVTPAPK